MYKRPLGTALHKEQARPHQLMNRTDDAQRFSSFESPPLSDKDNEQFSDFETSREKDKCRDKGQSSYKKEKSHILVEQLPLQADNYLSNRKKQDLSSSGMKGASSGKGLQLSTNKAVLSGTKGDNTRQKQNCPLRYNYMQKIERHLTTIHEDAKEDLRDSSFIPLPSKKLIPRPKVSPFDNLHLWNTYEHSLYNDPNIALLEKQSYEMLMLEQENISLRERVLFLQKQLRTRDEERLRKEAEIIVERMKNVAQEEQVSSTRKEAKLKLVEQVALLQSRCRQMKEQMRHYKEKQEETFSRLTRERQDVKLEVTMLKQAHGYQAKFTQMFLNMVEKLPIDLQEEWSNKRKIAVGWKVVKHLVKKAFKLGIHPPAIAQKDS